MIMLSLLSSSMIASLSQTMHKLSNPFSCHLPRVMPVFLSARLPRKKTKAREKTGPSYFQLRLMSLLGGLRFRDRRRSHFPVIRDADGFEEALHRRGIQSGRDLDIRLAGGQDRLHEVPCAECEDLLDSLGRSVLDQEGIFLIPAVSASARPSRRECRRLLSRSRAGGQSRKHQLEAVAGP